MYAVARVASIGYMQAPCNSWKGPEHPWTWEFTGFWDQSSVDALGQCPVTEGLGMSPLDPSPASTVIDIFFSHPALTFLLSSFSYPWLAAGASKTSSRLRSILLWNLRMAGCRLGDVERESRDYHA